MNLADYLNSESVTVNDEKVVLDKNLEPFSSSEIKVSKITQSVFAGAVIAKRGEEFAMWWGDEWIESSDLV